MRFLDVFEHMNHLIQTSSLNQVPELGNIRIFDSPLIGIASADDELFFRLQLPEVLGVAHRMPEDWLSGARTVISYFLPFTADIRVSNRQPGLPSTEWLYGRIEGQNFNAELSQSLVSQLISEGNTAVAPALDPRFQIVSRRSNWSERHVAFIAGLGTLSLNCSIITKAGSAGRLGSVVTNLDLPATIREYSGIYDYCTHCGVCIDRCPPSAVSDSGKDHECCEVYLNRMKDLFTPRYGCGKCQTAVPCESGIPLR